MSLYVTEDFLHFDYDEDNRIYDEKHFFEEDASEPFDKRSAKQMLLMMNRLSREMQLDEYSLKRLEVMLREDLPFFAINRRIILNWVSENFLF
jgi:hypothetical protein